VFGCVGIWRISRIASETPERGSATSRDLLFNDVGTHWLPEPGEQKKGKPEAAFGGVKGIGPNPANIRAIDVRNPR